MSDAAVSVDAVMGDLRGRIRERLRSELVRQGSSLAFEDPRLFADVESLLQRAANVGDSDVLLLAELLGEPQTWRLETSLRLQSHRPAGASAVILFFKRRVLAPALRWLFEYSRDNFERQRRVNRVLFACVQELAVETARLRQEVDRLARR